MSQTRQLAAIMFTDIVGYTSLMGQDEESAFALLEKNRQVQQPLIEKYGGRLLKEIGDGILASFNSAADAVFCALNILKNCQNHDGLSLRIGIHLGDVVYQNDDVFGDGVNIASRIQELASPGELLISEPVNQNISNKKGITTKYGGQKQLKGVKEQVKVYRVGERNSINSEDSKTEQKDPERNFKKAVWLIITVLLLSVVGYFIFSNRSELASGTEAEVYQEKWIAVLPFVDMSAEQDQEYLGDGIAEELINTFAQAKDLKVIARTSSFQFKGENLDIREVGSMLNVNYVIEGSVRKYEDQLRITVQLIDAEDGSHIWSEDYDHQFSEILTIQSQIAQSIFRELTSSLGLTPIESSAGTTNTKAYELYLKAVHLHLNKLYVKIDPTVEEFKEIEQLFKEVIRLDSDYADAFSGLADLYNSGIHMFPNDCTNIIKAESYADLAFKLDPESCYANIVKAQTYYERNEFKDAFNYSMDALGLCSSNIIAYHLLSLLLHDLGFHDESISIMEKGLQVDPINAPYWGHLGRLKTHVGRYNEAKQAFNEQNDLDDIVDGLFFLAIRTGDVEAARRYITESTRFSRPLDYYTTFLSAADGDTTAIQTAEKLKIPTTPHMRLYLTRANKNWSHINDDWTETDYYKALEQVQDIPNKCCGLSTDFINDTEVRVDKEYTDLIQPLLSEPWFKQALNSFDECRAENRKAFKTELDKLEIFLATDS